MADYRLTNRAFSRLWRRSKNYSDHEIRWLARKRGLEMRAHKEKIEVVDPKTGKIVANFQEIKSVKPENISERSRALASL